MPRYTFLCESWKSPPAVPNTRRNQFEFNLGFFEQAFVGSQLCLPYSISVISFITNWIWGSKSPSGLTGAFEIIFSLIRAGWCGAVSGGVRVIAPWIQMGFVDVKWQKLIMLHTDLLRQGVAPIDFTSRTAVESRRCRALPPVYVNQWKLHKHCSSNSQQHTLHSITTPVHSTYRKNSNDANVCVSVNLLTSYWLAPFICSFIGKM